VPKPNNPIRTCNLKKVENDLNCVVRSNMNIRLVT